MPIRVSSCSVVLIMRKSRSRFLSSLHLSTISGVIHAHPSTAALSMILNLASETSFLNLSIVWKYAFEIKNGYSLGLTIETVNAYRFLCMIIAEQRDCLFCTCRKICSVYMRNIYIFMNKGVMIWECQNQSCWK